MNWPFRKMFGAHLGKRLTKRQRFIYDFMNLHLFRFCCLVVLVLTLLFKVSVVGIFLFGCYSILMRV